MRRIRLSLAVAMTAAIIAAAPIGAVGAGPTGTAGLTAKAPVTNFTKDGNYIVQMADQPVVAYTGGIKGLTATAPKAGHKIDPNSGTVVAYTGYLNSKHAAALAKTGGTKLYDYDYSFSGYSARLTAAQANKTATLSGVIAVTPDEMQTVDTSSTPAFLGLTAAGGLWEQLGGVGSAGDGIIIGDIDTGIWPESLSFADRTLNNVPSFSPTAKLAYQQIPGWHGKCTPGEAFVASNCNQKLIGAQWFDAGFGGDAGVNANMPWEFTSARDYNGHGTHTASTAGGNNGVPVTGPAAAYGTISGMAPHARIAMYKALWTLSDGTGSGYNSDLVAAIDMAVHDGVDVINYSISGTSTNFLDPVEVSFLYAAQAGIFVAESAGNSGPTTGTVAHPGPWTTTVAAGTHNRSALGTVTMGDGTAYTGASVSSSEVSAPIINAADAAAAGADATKVALCYAAVDNGGTAVLDSAKVAGKIVVCDRGVTNRVNKSLAVLEAGGVGMVLVNPSPNSLNADFHSVPTVHLDSNVYVAVHAYAGTTGATATISKSHMDYNTPAPYTASFSSRGPLAATGDLLKPDLIAPGQDILAAVAPPGNSGRSFDLYSGTSMSSPHVAGLAALLKDLHPSWSPMAIKSALMTSAYDVLDGPNTSASVIFRQGAGHVKPNSAADPGLVFDSTMTDWLGFLCGTQLGASYCTSRGIPVVSPSNFNGASIAIGSLPGSQTVTRTVTNVGLTTATYTASFSGAGISASVSPATFTLSPGQKRTLQITISTAGAALNAYTGGQLTWSDGTHTVRIPVVAKPVALAAPAEVSSSYNVTFGYTGSFTATARGLVPATTFAGSINTGQQLTYNVIVPAGTTYARFSLFNATTTPGSDLDLYVYRGTTLVGSSGGGTSDEEVDFLNPTAATYTVLVDGYGTANPSTFTLFTWVLGSTDAGNMIVSAPTTATLGGTGTINLSFSGLTAGTKYLGSVAYGGAAGMPNPTIVRVDP